MVKYFSWSTQLTCFNPRNVTKRLGKIGDKYGKIRSCSLGQRGVSASLLDLQDKNITFNENVNDLVQTSIKSLRKFTSSGITLPLVTPVWYKLVSADEAEVVSLSQTSFAACSMTSKVTLHDVTSHHWPPMFTTLCRSPTRRCCWSARRAWPAPCSAPTRATPCPHPGPGPGTGHTESSSTLRDINNGVLFSLFYSCYVEGWWDELKTFSFVLCLQSNVSGLKLWIIDKLFVLDITGNCTGGPGRRLWGGWTPRCTAAPPPPPPPPSRRRPWARSTSPTPG